jgi:hypothetical protein
MADNFPKAPHADPPRRLSEKASVEWPIVAVGEMKGENNASL